LTDSPLVAGRLEGTRRLLEMPLVASCMRETDGEGFALVVTSGPVWLTFRG